MDDRANDDGAAMAELGRRVRDRRLELGLSQEHLAETSALHRTFIGSIERGERNPSLVSLVRISAALELDPGTLLADLHVAPRARRARTARGDGKGAKRTI